MSGVSERGREIRKIWGGFLAARVLLTANNYKVFDFSKKQRTAKALAKDIGTDRRATEILLDALTGLGLLSKKNSRYTNTDIASQFLVSESPFYQGDIIRHVDALWDNWSGLDKVLKTGKPNHVSHNHSAFILGMHNLSVLKAKNIINASELRGVNKALDLGGGPGTYSIEMAKKGIQVVLFDRPETIKIAKHVINKTAARSENKSKENIKNISFIQGDFLYDKLGKNYDAILISQIFHAYSEKDIIRLLKKCRSALSNSGRIVIQEFLIGDNRTHPEQSALFSINMLVNTTGGRCYSPVELKTWLLMAGFKKVKKKLIDDCVLMIAWK